VSESEDTDPACPLALKTTAPTEAATLTVRVPAGWWTSHRKWFVDGSIVAGCVAGAWRGAIDWETVVPIITSVLLAHAAPGSTSLETAAGPLLRALPKLLRRAP
jgi:hypothetical protein